MSTLKKTRDLFLVCYVKGIIKARRNYVKKSSFRTTTIENYFFFIVFLFCFIANHRLLMLLLIIIQPTKLQKQTKQFA